MKHLAIFFLIFFISCYTAKKASQIASPSVWSTISTNNSSSIKVATTFYNGYQGLHDCCIDILTKMHFEIADNSNPITTKPRSIFNNIPAKYSLLCHDSDVIISGVYGAPSLGRLSWERIVKGKDPFGTPLFEKMKVFAEAIKGGTIYYADH